MADALVGWTVDATLAIGPDRVVLRARQGDQAPVALKATPAGAGWSARADLRREARVLEAGRGHGVVPLLDVLDGRGRTVLVLGFVPAGTLAGRVAPDPDAAFRHLEATVHRLHGAGIVHGALRPEHVALDADGLPVLVGFGAARRSPATAADHAAVATLRQTLRSGA